MKIGRGEGKRDVTFVLSAIFLSVCWISRLLLALSH